MKLSEMRQILQDHGIQLTKSLGQNFLHDGNQLGRIADLANLSTSDKVLEIGPGLGPLTEVLMKRVGQVMAIELDRKLSDVLRTRFEGSSSFSLHHVDALHFLREKAHDWTGWKVVSNLPYSVASPILVELASSPMPPSQIVATLQWEVVKRLRAKAGTKDYGVLTLLVAQRYQTGAGFKIPANCFFPQPNVDSGCLSMELRNPQPVPWSDLQTFQTLVKLAFSQRRKMMVKLLRTRWNQADVEKAMGACDLPLSIRAEQLSLEQFVELMNHLGA